PPLRLGLYDDCCIRRDGITKDGTVNVSGLEDGDTWQYSTDGGVNWTDGEGDSFLLPDGIYTEGKVLAKQTDVAGNTSDDGILKSWVSVVDETLAAANNSVDLVLDVEPTKTENPKPSDLNKTGFTVVSVGLGPVLGAGVLNELQGKAVELEVGENQVREVSV